MNDDASPCARLWVFVNRNLVSPCASRVFLGVEGEGIGFLFIDLRDRVDDLWAITSAATVLDHDGMGSFIVDKFFWESTSLDGLKHDGLAHLDLNKALVQEGLTQHFCGLINYYLLKLP